MLRGQRLHLSITQLIPKIRVMTLARDLWGGAREKKTLAVDGTVVIKTQGACTVG